MPPSEQTTTEPPAVPQLEFEWYSHGMSGTHFFTIGDRGRVVLPIELRQSRNWSDGTVLFALEEENGVRILSRDELHDELAEAMKGSSLADELIAERHAANGESA